MGRNEMRSIYWLIFIAIVAGVIGVMLVSYFIIIIPDLSAKGTIAAGAIALFGVIFSALYKEISVYYQERTEIICRKWDLIFPFIKDYYNAWIHTAESLLSSLNDFNPDKPNSLVITRIFYFTTLFYGYRLRFILNGGGLILLTTLKENNDVTAAYRKIGENFQWAGDETAIHISHLQELFTVKHKMDSPFVLYVFSDEVDDNEFLTKSKNKLQSWLMEADNLNKLKDALEKFIKGFRTSINKLYTTWGDRESHEQ
jgi:hypothetical protein